MRAVAFAFVALSFGSITPAAAQSFGPGPYSDDLRSDPPRYYTERPHQDSERAPYFTDRPPSGRPGEGFQPPPYRGAPPDRGQRYDRAGEARPGAWPGPDPRDREPPPVRRRVEQPPPWPSEAGDRGGRGAQTTVRPPNHPLDGAPPRPTIERRPERPGPRGVDRITVSVEEFRDLQNRVRELERLLAERHDFRDDRRGPDRPPIYR